MLLFLHKWIYFLEYIKKNKHTIFFIKSYQIWILFYLISVWSFSNLTFFRLSRKFELPTLFKGNRGSISVCYLSTVKYNRFYVYEANKHWKFPFDHRQGHQVKVINGISLSSIMKFKTCIRIFRRMFSTNVNYD